ncbi:primosomal protein N' [Pseudogracilibacillus sp. SE30717A]|uniref:primosomal protein N' n=1 Tax=Pseudogracilibacillus sp. SE30717A TaxID=3098293 RepID=UPI00300DC321
MNIAKVIVDVPSSVVNQTFDYRIPEKFQEMLKPGMRVVIPFGPRKITGFVIKRIHESSYENLREIMDVLDITPVLTDELLQLGRWLAEKTVSLYISTYQAMLPQVLKAKYSKEIIRLTDIPLPNVLEQKLQQKNAISFEEALAVLGSYKNLQYYIEKGDLAVQYVVASKATKRYKTLVYPSSPEHLKEGLKKTNNRAIRQKEILQFFIQHPYPIDQTELYQQLQINRSNLKALIDKELLTLKKVEVYRNPYEEEFKKTKNLQLTDEQELAIRPINNSIENNVHKTFLLYGVTGSGKTEIYLQAIEKVIHKGKEAIVLVPEISLTPQMVKRFKGRFGSNVAVLHSALSVGEKYDEWRKIHRKEVKVVVGARSAIFAPFENLGIIIIDEEHETTYKQEESPRYHARDVAIKRGEYNDCPVILGSATPTLESYARGKKDVYHLLKLTKRTNEKPMPQVDIIDMRKELHEGNRTMFSRALTEKIKACLIKQEQIVLLLNRRGYSTFALCRDCGHVEECPNCDISLTFHKGENALKCHYCGHEQPMPIYCPNCESTSIRFFGTGTERVEEALTKLIPEAKIIRMDVDTTRKKGAHERLLKRFAEKEADILLGTQMIAKGLDFENVTLVGVLAADSMLHLPDFRSSEKTFQLITQVSGRAGRHELTGEVIVQTYTPDHYSIELASKYDFETFFNHEMQIRKTFLYPPYVFLALITISHENEQNVYSVAQQIRSKLENKLHDGSFILGPSPSPIARIKNRYRYQLMIKYRHEPYLQQSINKILEDFQDERRRDLQILIDFNPYQLM